MKMVSICQPAYAQAAAAWQQQHLPASSIKKKKKTSHHSKSVMAAAWHVTMAWQKAKNFWRLERSGVVMAINNDNGD